MGMAAENKKGTTKAQFVQHLQPISFWSANYLKEDSVGGLI